MPERNRTDASPEINTVSHFENSGELFLMKVGPSFQERLWGRKEPGSWVSTQSAEPDRAGTRIGEVWLTAGANLVVEGAWKGRTLDDAWHGLGYPHFPLLAKFLFTSDKLSVQVHPPDEFAERHEQSPGKTEMWYVMESEPGSRVAVGFDGPPPVDLRKLAESGRIEQHLGWIDAPAGSTFFIPAGTVHAIGSGLTICEIQQASDVTYRLYDYGRRDSEGRLRPLHVDKAVEVAIDDPRAGRVSPIERKSEWGTRTLLAACNYFTTELIEIDSPAAFAPGGIPEIWIGLKGSAALRTSSDIRIEKGEAVVVAGEGSLRIEPAGKCLLLRTFLPADPQHPAPDWDGAAR